jgi:hypothetical protein
MRELSRASLLLPRLAPIDREDAVMNLIVLLAAFAVSAALGLTLAWGSLAVLFWSIDTRSDADAQRTVNGSISSVRVPSVS